MIEKPFGDVEPGSDYFVSNGVPFETGLYGWEAKGDAYTCKVTALADMPKPIQVINNAMIPIYKKYSVDGAVSTELRINKNKVASFTDICSRFGNPPAGCISSIYENLPQVMRGIAHGYAVKPKFRSKFASEITVDSIGACVDPVPFEFNPEKEWMSVKIRTACRVNGTNLHIPFCKNGETIIKAVGLGNTQDESEKAALDAAEKFVCPRKNYNNNSFNELHECIESGKKYGLSGSL
jgi:hypothetical protein